MRAQGYDSPSGGMRQTIGNVLTLSQSTSSHSRSTRDASDILSLSLRSSSQDGTSSRTVEARLNRPSRVEVDVDVDVDVARRPEGGGFMSSSVRASVRWSAIVVLVVVLVVVVVVFARPMVMEITEVDVEIDIVS